MRNLIFIEGVSGVGKSTMVQSIGSYLQKAGWNTEIHLEGDAYSPLDLCWTAYLRPEEYMELLSRFPHDTALFSKHLIHTGEYLLLRYRVDRISQRI